MKRLWLSLFELLGVGWSLFITIAMLVYQILAWGFVLSKLWNWFIFPIFPLLPMLSFSAAVGLYIFKTALFFKVHDLKTTKVQDRNSYFPAIVIAPWFSLLTGWLFS